MEKIKNKTENKTMKTPVGLILYDGKSMIDGKPIVCIATSFLRGENEKTGKMIQTWILRKDIHPCEAVQSGEDKSICGDCKHKHLGSCYVTSYHGPSPIFKAYQRGTYKPMTMADMVWFNGRKLRLGAYGDPAAVPTYVWHSLCSVAKGWTGYTNQWKTCDPAIKRYCMASVDSMEGYYKEKMDAVKMGWRTFRTSTPTDNTLFDDEMVCPASHEAGKITDCSNCSACCGCESNRKNPVIKAHGWGWKIQKFVKGMMKIKQKKGWKKEYPSFPRIQKNKPVISVDKEVEQVKILIQGL
jgi:hypothetical protein